MKLDIFLIWVFSGFAMVTDIHLQVSQVFSENADTTKALVTSFFFVGSFAVMGLYMFLLFIQNKKQDYLLYATYLLLFTFYFFLRIDDVLRFDIFQSSYAIHKHLLTPLLFVITAVYVRFINVFAEIKAYNRSFSKRLDIFCVLLFITAGGMVLFTAITQDFEWVRQHRSYFTIPMHLYTLMALIRAFIIIKSKIRHYILWSNIFLFTFSIIGVYSANAHGGQETITSNDLYGFYSFNASQVGIFLEMICFSLGLGYKFSLIEKEKEEVTEKYIQELQRNELVTKQLNEDLSALVERRTLEIEKKNIQLQQEQELKTKFFTNISHELRTPLTLISGPIQNQLENSQLKPEDRKALTMVTRNANRLLSLVDQLLDISKLDAGSTTLSVQKLDFKKSLLHLLESFEYYAKKKGITFEYTLNFKKESVWFDPDIVDKILTNLLSNAVKYTPENGLIRVIALIDSGLMRCEVQNSGPGLTAKQMERVFDRFYQVAENRQDLGTGIGLAFVKDLVKLHKGQISVSSTPGNQTVFRFEIPIEKQAYKDGDFYVNSESNLLSPNSQHALDPELNLNAHFADSETIDPAESNNFKNSDKHVLIVEDNPDMRSYLGTLLGRHYNILYASNGKEGFEKAVKAIPDLVISDVMMPLTDGLSLSKSLKQDLRTSHIPLVLLTAKAGRENQLEGLRTGADDYLTKPFNNDMLLTKVSGLLANNERVKKYYLQEASLSPPVISLNPMESRFRQQLRQILKDHLQDSEFNTDCFCRKMGMSRMQLHRKLKATIGVSATEFLNRERLKVAKSMLVESSLSISEIAYSTGFNSPNYFGRIFKQRVGTTPGSYREKAGA